MTTVIYSVPDGTPAVVDDTRAAQLVARGTWALTNPNVDSGSVLYGQIRPVGPQGPAGPAGPQGPAASAAAPPFPAILANNLVGATGDFYYTRPGDQFSQAGQSILPAKRAVFTPFVLAKNATLTGLSVYTSNSLPNGGLAGAAIYSPHATLAKPGALLSSLTAVTPAANSATNFAASLSLTALTLYWAAIWDPSVGNSWAVQQTSSPADSMFPMPASGAFSSNTVLPCWYGSTQADWASTTAPATPDLTFGAVGAPFLYFKLNTP